MAGDAPVRRRKWQFTLRSLLLLMLGLVPVFGWIGVRMQRARHRAEFERQFAGDQGFVWENGELIEAWFGRSVDDAQISRLRGLSSIRVLRIGDTPCATDASMATIGELKSLQALVLTDTGITDAGFAQLRTLPNLQTLILRGKNITDAHLAQLRALPALRFIRLYATGITDSGLRYLAAVPCLRELELRENNITDAGLALLPEYPNLEYVHLQDNPHITEEGVQSCRERMPNAKIDYCPFADQETIDRYTP